MTVQLPGLPKRKVQAHINTPWHDAASLPGRLSNRLNARLSPFLPLYSPFATAAIIAPYLLIFLSLSCMVGGCTLRERGMPVPAWERTGSLRTDLISRAKSIRSISIAGRIWLSIRGRKFPSVKVNAWLYTGDNRRLLRLRGSGPFGMAVFDLLADNKDAWIYLPKEGRIYRGNEWATSYGTIDIDTALHVAEMCLNPWSPVMHAYFREVSCNGTDLNRLCLSGRMLGRHFRLEYSMDSLSPVGFYASDVEIEFKTGSDTGYPEDITFSIGREGISGRFHVKKAGFNSIPADNGLFDREIFLRSLASCPSQNQPC